MKELKIGQGDYRKAKCQGQQGHPRQCTTPAPACKKMPLSLIWWLLTEGQPRPRGVGYFPLLQSRMSSKQLLQLKPSVSDFYGTL